MDEETRRDAAPAAKRPEYDPPEVERVMSADELAREVHYAGGIPLSDFPG